ncbi:MAG: hypothetical protein ACTHJF_09500 [Dyella sp.]
MHTYKGALISRMGRISLVVLLWAGLALCGLMVRRYWEQSSAVLVGLGLEGWAVVSLACLLLWICAVVSWQRAVVAYGGALIAWWDAARHLALLLVGKYIPGGIWGFTARLADSASRRPFAGMLAAGVSEQWFGILMAALGGGLGLLCAKLSSFVPLILVILLPFAAVTGVEVARRVARLLMQFAPARLLGLCTSMAVDVNWVMLSGAAVLTMMQATIMLVIVGYVAHSAYSLDRWGILAVAGGYGLGVTAGMAVIFMPGGILVREMVFVLLCRSWIPQAEAIALAGCLRLIFTGFDFAAAAIAGVMQVGRHR